MLMMMLLLMLLCLSHFFPLFTERSMYTNAFSETGRRVTEPVVSAAACVPATTTGLALPVTKKAKTVPLTKVKNTGLKLDGTQQAAEVDMLNPLARSHTTPSGSAIKSFDDDLTMNKLLSETIRLDCFGS
jgi:hypothetical protein